MKNRWTGGLVLALFALLGCESGKQAAVLAMDEARLNIAAAEKAGAEKLAGYSLGQAKLHIARAQDRFADKEFGNAKSAANLANVQAIDAINEAKRKEAQLAAEKRAPKSQKSLPKKTTPKNRK